MADTPAQPRGPAPRWRVLVTPRWMGWHLFAVAAVIGMLWLGDWQLRRALGGNILSWAYTFEWPIFAIFGVVFWAKTVKDELRPAQPEEPQPEQVSLPAGAVLAHPARPEPGTGDASAADGDRARVDQEPAEPADAELAEYNAYLARLGNEARGHGKWHGLR